MARALSAPRRGKGEPDVTCRNYKNRPEILEDYVGGALQAADAEQLRLHLETCAECRAQEEEARSAGALLRSAFTPAQEPSGAFWTRLLAQLRAEEGRLAIGGDFWGSVERLAWRLSFGAAALVVLLLGIVIGTQMPARRSSEAPLESREIFQEPAVQPADQDEVLLEMASVRNGRNP